MTLAVIGEAEFVDNACVEDKVFVCDLRYGVRIKIEKIGRGARKLATCNHQPLDESPTQPVSHRQSTACLLLYHSEAAVNP